MLAQISMADERSRAGRSAGRGRGAGARAFHLAGSWARARRRWCGGLLRGLGYAGRVKSPTYALVEPYALSRLDLYHFDFYRFKDRSEWLNSGFREHFNPASVCVVEWPEKAGDCSPPPDLDIRLDFDGEARRARLEALLADAGAILALLPCRLCRSRASAGPVDAHLAGADYTRLTLESKREDRVHAVQRQGPRAPGARPRDQRAAAGARRAERQGRRRRSVHPGPARRRATGPAWCAWCSTSRPR